MVDRLVVAGKRHASLRETDPMATTPRPSARRKIEYPTSDGKPMAETDVHRQNMVDLIETLHDRYANDPDVYVSGNLLLFYEEGNRRKHVAPDVFLVRGVPKLPMRDNYLVWEEGKAPDLVVELTSRTTRREDRKKKRTLYRDVLKVPEYFLFDPNAEWLKPPLQGYRLAEGDYVSIEPVAAHFLPSEVLGLHLVRSGYQLRLFDPATGRELLTRRERLAEAEAMRRQAEAARQEAALQFQLAEARTELAELRQRDAELTRQRIEAELERLRLENEALRRSLSGGV
jgi:Uma2 family endonuclease